MDQRQAGLPEDSTHRRGHAAGAGMGGSIRALNGQYFPATMPLAGPGRKDFHRRASASSPRTSNAAPPPHPFNAGVRLTFGRSVPTLQRVSHVEIAVGLGRRAGEAPSPLQNVEAPLCVTEYRP
jgi:hypothetical protein